MRNLTGNLTVWIALALAGAALTTTGCEEKGTFEKAGEAIDEAIDDASQDAEEAKKKLSKALE